MPTSKQILSKCEDNLCKMGFVKETNSEMFLINTNAGIVEVMLAHPNSKYEVIDLFIRFKDLKKALALFRTMDTFPVISEVNGKANRFNSVYTEDLETMMSFLKVLPFEQDVKSLKGFAEKLGFSKCEGEMCYPWGLVAENGNRLTLQFDLPLFEGDWWVAGRIIGEISPNLRNLVRENGTFDFHGNIGSQLTELVEIFKTENNEKY